MSQWSNPSQRQSEHKIDPEILEEAALATAQATIQNAMNQAGLSPAELARKMGRPRSFISRILSGSHNLTVRTMARVLYACGLEARFDYAVIQWGWAEPEMEVAQPIQWCESVSALEAGTPVSAY